MSLFLRQADHYGAALKTFDPFEKEPFINLLDPLRSKDSLGPENGKLRFQRVVLLLILMFGPIVISCVISNPLAGGNLFGTNGLARDIGMILSPFTVSLTLILLMMGRRLLGHLINTLIISGTVGESALKGFSPESTTKGKILDLFEWLSRVGLWRAIFWITLFFCLQSLSYYFNFIGFEKSHWTSSPAVEGTFLYWFHVGKQQPNIAGIWSFCVMWPPVFYLVLLVVRLFVSFACICKSIANDQELRLIPSHPDKTGGLLAVGQTSFFLSLFLLIYGVALVNAIFSEILRLKVAGVVWDNNLLLLMITLGLYFSLGSLLFFMPMWPLRSKMAEAKQAYLHEVESLYVEVDKQNRTLFQKMEHNKELLDGQSSLKTLFESASEMAVWPFDKKTFTRFASVLFAPVTPLITGQAPQILTLIKAYLGVS